MDCSKLMPVVEYRLVIQIVMGVFGLVDASVAFVHGTFTDCVYGIISF